MLVWMVWCLRAALPMNYSMLSVVSAMAINISVSAFSNWCATSKCKFPIRRIISQHRKQTFCISLRVAYELEKLQKSSTYQSIR